MMGPLPRLSPKREESGATLVEFALVAPILFVMLFGLIAGCFLAYQNSALHDGATAGSRMASIETSLVTEPTSGPYANEYCESDSPTSIESAIAAASPLLTVNPARLCATVSSANSASNVDSLTQTPVNGDVNITVNCTPDCTAPTTVAVSLAYSTQGLVAPFGFTYNMSATSAVPTESP
jgi:Flp pilus assembly protein TadG